MKIGFIFTNYYTFEHCEKVVTSLSTQKSFYEFTIVIVDNNSDNKNKSALEKLTNTYINVKIIINPENLGYFRGLNVGISYLKMHYPDIKVLVVGNNDLIFKNNFYENLLNKSYLFETIPVISPNIVTTKGEYQNPHVIKNVSFFREVIYDFYYSSFMMAKIIKKIASITRNVTKRSDEKQHNIPQFINQGHGSCYILGPIFFKNFKELFAPTFLMGEEFFLSLQLREKKFKIFYEPSIEIEHCWHSSFHTLPIKRVWLIGKESHKIYRKYKKPYILKKW